MRTMNHNHFDYIIDFFLPFSIFDLVVDRRSLKVPRTARDCPQWNDAFISPLVNQNVELADVFIFHPRD